MSYAVMPLSDWQDILNSVRAKTGKNNALTSADVPSEIDSISGLDSSVIEFPQMNDLVTAYLADADAKYTDSNGASVSVIGNYGTSTGDRDRPLGLSIKAQSGTQYVLNEKSGVGSKLTNLLGGKSTIYNAIPNEVSQYLVKDSNGNLLDNGRIKPTGKVRMIKFYGYPQNCRDLGGWNCDGGTVKYGKLFRGSAVGAIDATTIDIVKGLGIHHEIDLRESNELTANSFADIVHYHHYPLGLYFADVIDPTKGDYNSIKNILRTVFDAVTHNEAVFYHCAIGRDRTGTVSALLLSILGVAVKDIDKDFELTSFSALNTPANRTSSAYRGLITALANYRNNSLMDGAVTWCMKAGFSIDEINAFRSAMVNGTPTVLKAEDYVTTYTVTQTLPNCSSSFSNNVIAEDVSFDATITPFTGYQVTSLKVTMGGTDITASAVSGNKISIAAVTGNIVITVTTAVIIAYTNQLPISTDKDGNVYNGTGYKTSTRLNSSGEDTSGSGMCATGYIPCKIGDVIRLKGINYNKNSTNVGNHRCAFFDSNKTYISMLIANSSTSAPDIVANGVYDSTGDLIQFTVPEKINTISLSGTAFFRICGDTFDSTRIITVNEEIV